MPFVLSLSKGGTSPFVIPDMSRDPPSFRHSRERGPSKQRTPKMKNYPDGPPPPRTFTLNSKEFYEAITPPPEYHLWGPGLPREPRTRDLPVIVEPSTERSGAGGGARSVGLDGRANRTRRRRSA